MRYLILIYVSFICICLLGLSACSDNNQSATQSESSDTSATQESAPADTLASLGEQLAEKQAAFNEKADPEKKQVYEQGIAEVQQSPLIKNAVNVGDKAPDFTLPNAAGEPVKLYELLEQGPVVLNWYRGGWCPYCNLTLRAYQHRMDKIETLGATFVAISPEMPDSSLSTKEKNELAFTVLSDKNNRVAKLYNIVFKLNDKVLAYYNKGANFQSYYEGGADELPLAATYVIAPDGTVEYAFLDADYRKRAEPEEVMAVLERLESSMQ